MDNSSSLYGIFVVVSKWNFNFIPLYNVILYHFATQKLLIKTDQLVLKLQTISICELPSQSNIYILYIYYPVLWTYIHMVKRMAKVIA